MSLAFLRPLRHIAQSDGNNTHYRPCPSLVMLDPLIDLARQRKREGLARRDPLVAAGYFTRLKF